MTTQVTGQLQPRTVAWMQQTQPSLNGRAVVNWTEYFTQVTFQVLTVASVKLKAVCTFETSVNVYGTTVKHPRRLSSWSLYIPKQLVTLVTITVKNWTLQTDTKRHGASCRELTADCYFRPSFVRTVNTAHAFNSGNPFDSSALRRSQTAGA
jgi:hypothetical protein